MQQENYQPSEAEAVKSPTLEALCQDLDLFINELSLGNNDKPTTIQLNHNNLSTDFLEESYSPLIENYSRFSQAELPHPKNHEANMQNKFQNSTPPTSPSYLTVNNTSEEYPFTTRTSSLNRTVSSSSGHRLSTIPQFLFSNPSSPSLSSGASNFPDYALLSFISSQFINNVKSLNERRKIFCTEEYPLSFNGEEAVNIVRSFIPYGLSTSTYLKIVRALHKASPPLIEPIHYSEKATKKNKFYNSSREVYTLISSEPIQGIYTPLTRCYSHSCLPGQPGCYSSLCPNKTIRQEEPSLHKLAAPSVSSSVSHDTGISRAWSANVSKDILMALPKNEITRQEAIHELIYTEEDYVRDLKLLDELYVKELLNGQVMEESRKKEFCDKVFNNYMELLEIHKGLCNELKDYQAYCQSISAIGSIDQIGDIFLRHTDNFLATYLQYGPHVVLAEYEAKREAESNIMFQTFIGDKEKRAESRRLPFRHFIVLPVTRLQRYSLLLDAVLKKTPEGHSDRKALTACIEVVKKVAMRVDEATLKTKNTLRIYEINQRIRFKPGEPHNLDLLKTGRRLLKEGILTRRPHLVVETVELHVFLFDHLLLMTKVKKAPNKSDDVEYTVSKKPIPMALLHIQEATEGFSIGLRTMSSTTDSMMTSSTSHPSIVNASSLPFGTNFPFLIQHLGRHGADHMLYAENATVRLEWKEKVIEAKATMEAAQVDKCVFEIQSLSDTTFGGSNSPTTHNHGKVTCTIPFMSSSNTRMVAIGTVQGIWMGTENDTNSMRLVLSVSDVTQIAVLEEHRILLVLSDKTLYAHSLEHLLNKDLRKNPHDRSHQKVAQHITFFQAGVCNGRTLVVAMKKRGVDSHFKVLEPICGDLRDPANSKKYFTKSGLFSRPPSWFKSYIEFYIGTESYSVHFLKARLVVVCSRGFEIVNLEALSQNRNLPDSTHSDFAFVQQKGQELKPLGMFRCRENYLLCYDEFAFMVNTHGALVRETPLIEWEGSPQSVAFSYPYVVGFDPRFIEVRHVETGELIQVLAGIHMRCLQFITHQASPVIHGCMAHPFKPDFQYVFSLVGKFEASS
ncbi:CNH domain-containing protein [Sporodiniella umbellata]|nr:CNH domain-containing protein [Sporodiniella umbellata]